jgi:tetratricopeptide (TPR) repeat protein
MTFSTTRTLLAAACVLLAAHAGANEYSAFFKAGKFAEAERAADARLATEPSNADALVAKSRAILGAGPESRIEQAVKLGEQCMAAYPQASNCQLAYGNALGTKAINAGIMSAIGYAGKIRDAFKKAVELDPNNLEARFSLLQYYMQAPSVVGGGSGKAKDLATQTATVNPEASKLMFATLDMSDDAFAKAEAAVLAVRPNGNEAVAEHQEQLLSNLGGQYLSEKKFADSERVYRELAKRYPDSEWGPYGLARIDQEQGKFREAIGGFEKALVMSARPIFHYRIARSWQSLNDKPKAIAAYERALASKTGLPKKFRGDAEDQVKSLKG